MLADLPARLARLDLAELVKNLDGLLRSKGARSQTAPLDVLLVHGKRTLPIADMASVVLESDRIARAVLTHVRVAPLLCSVVVCIHPRPEIDAPVLLSDLRVAPSGRTSLYVDVAGPSVARPSFMSGFHRPLCAVLDRLDRSIQRTPTPGWMAPLAGGCGANLHVHRTESSRLVRVLIDYVDTYVDALRVAPAAPDASANAASARSVADVVRANGAAGRHLARAFGDAPAARYLRLLWNEAA
jgi:hypothetical protein